MSYPIYLTSHNSYNLQPLLFIPFSHFFSHQSRNIKRLLQSLIASVTLHIEMQEPQALGPRQTARSHSGGAARSEGSTAQKPTGAGVDTGAGTTREKTEAEMEADRKYEEAMEEEYAKRDGGA